MIQVINKCAQIINLIASDPTKAWPLSIIADTIGINRGTCSNILKSLVATGYLEKSLTGKGYVLGYQIFKLAGAGKKNSLIGVAKPIMDKLSLELNETIMLSVLKGKTRLLLYQSTCTHDIQVLTPQKSNVFRTTTGKMILSRYSQSQLTEFINTYGLPDEEWPGITGRMSFFSELEKIRNLDCLVTISETHVAALAVPIVLPDRTYAALGVYLPDIRFSEERKEVMRSQLIQAKKQIEESLLLASPQNEKALNIISETH